jgi:cyclase
MTATMPTETTPTETGTFLFVPPFAGPVMEWRPEYGTIDDEGETIEMGGGVLVYSSPSFSFDVNTVMVLGTDGAAVLDAQMLPLHAERVLAEVRARTDVPVRYVTHSHHHPDHIFGGPVFAAAGAETVSSYLTARLIDGTASANQLFLMGMYGEYAPQGFVVPRTTFVRSRELWLGETVVQLFELGDGASASGESVDMTLAWLPQSQVLHVGDTLEPGTHTFFSEGVSVPDWLTQLGQLRELIDELRPRVIVPGHGAPGDAGMIDSQERYLTTIASIVEDHTRGGEVALDDEARDKLRAEIVSAFPGYRNPIGLDISLEMVQLLGPVSFLNGRPGGTTPRRTPTFR